MLKQLARKVISKKHDSAICYWPEDFYTKQKYIKSPCTKNYGNVKKKFKKSAMALTGVNYPIK